MWQCLLVAKPFTIIPSYCSGLVKCQEPPPAGSTTVRVELAYVVTPRSLLRACPTLSPVTVGCCTVVPRWPLGCLACHASLGPATRGRLCGINSRIIRCRKLQMIRNPMWQCNVGVGISLTKNKLGRATAVQNMAINIYTIYGILHHVQTIVELLRVTSNCSKAATLDQSPGS